MTLPDVGDRSAVEQYVRTAQMLTDSGSADLARRGKSMMRDVCKQCKEASKSAASKFADALRSQTRVGLRPKTPHAFLCGA